MIQVRETQNNKGSICNRFLRSLPQWFGIESAIVDYTNDVESMPMPIGENDSGHTLGFLALNFHNEFNAEIHIMAVLPEHHGCGIGSKLVKAAEAYARNRGARYLTVKTLSPSRPNREYDLTRKFYLKSGFNPLEEFKTLWGEANPCLLMIKSLPSMQK